jgi:endonuclease YncB( thermonuclease family)
MFALNAIHFIPASKKCWILRVGSTNSAKSMACRNAQKLNFQTLKNALNGRFFMPALLFFSSSCYSADNHQPSCVSTHFDEKVTIDYVIDGDTVILKDKRHIRLIGINTPELGHNKKPSEDGAKIARDSLIQIISSHPSINLLYGQERRDRHGRTLAHLYLEDGTNVQAEILRQGLAMPLRIPPNLTKLDCYNSASQFAKNNNLGLWSLPRYQTKKVSLLNGNERGFYFVSGKVEKITESRSSLWINLENNFALRIIKEDLNNFDKTTLVSLQGKTIEANGWLYKRKGQLRMRIRHPLDLAISMPNQ